MGVTGLWKLIEPCGKPVPVETLEGKVLAVDISIWLHQVVKGFQDNKGSALANAHLLGLFHRLCKLLYYRVRPVFVFDGCVPQLKRDTIARRQQQRSKLNNEADRIQTLLLEALAKEKVVQQALGASATDLLKSPVKRVTRNARPDIDDMFKLPELPAPLSNANKNKDPNNINADIDDDADADSDVCTDSSYTSYTTDEYASTTATADDSSFDELNPRHSYNSNLQTIDVRSQHFRNLPADVRHEILVDIKETRKQSSWGRLHELPPRSDDFSVFQMKRLLKRRAVQESLEEAEQEMGGRTLTYAELQNFFTEEGLLEPSAMEKGSKQICSDENTRYLLVRDLKKKLSKVPEEKFVEKELSTKEEMPSASKVETIRLQAKHTSETLSDLPSTSTQNDAKTAATTASSSMSSLHDSLGKEYKTDLELAIALSLEQEDTSTNVYREKDYDFESNESLHLNREQRRQLKNAAIGPARAYMIEYAGMNDDEVENIMDKTQIDGLDVTDADLAIQKILEESAKQNLIKSTESIKTISEKADIVDEIKVVEVDKPEQEEKSTNASENEESQQESMHLRVSDSSDTDSDLEEVETITNDGTELKNVESINTSLPKDKKSIEIAFSLNEIQTDLQDDIFADVFKEEMELEKEQKPVLTDIKAEPTTERENLLKHENTKISPNTTECKQRKEQIETKGKTNILSILDDLKKQADEVVKINLDDIKLNTTNIIEISDEEVNICRELPKTPIKNNSKKEIIEICDSDDGNDAHDVGEHKKKSAHLSITPNSSPKLNNSKSPQFKTPTKNRIISQYFDTEYVIKRTPEKSKDNEEENIPKVKSPFFVKKTPPSSTRKRGALDSSNSNSPTPTKISKASKELCFETNKNVVEQIISDDDGINEKVEAAESMELTKSNTPPSPLNAEEVLKEAAAVLKENKTDKELRALATDLAQQRTDLENERNRQDRMGMSISQRMNADCQELLRLFGIPYIVAPMEAEAQCAFLDAVELTNGTITDDSDIWLFGGRTVYKNFFAQNKHILEFRADKIEQCFNCDRKKLIQLACLVGSDYTIGVHGIGAVTALEILALFSAASAGNSDLGVAVDSRNSRETIKSILTNLSRFRDWWLSSKTQGAVLPGSSARLALHKKLKNIELHDGFPSTAVIEAYLTPKIDESKDAFSWGTPDVGAIREFARKSFGWTRTKTEEILMPVMKKLNDKKTQASIRNYFNVKGALKTPELKVSKRVQKAIKRLSGQQEDEHDQTPKAKSKRTKRATAAATATKRKQQQNAASEETQVDNDVHANTEDLSSAASGSASTSNASKAGKPKLSKLRAPRLPTSKEVIPQREKDLEEMRLNKEKAAAILKSTVATNKTKKKRTT